MFNFFRRFTRGSRGLAAAALVTLALAGAAIGAPKASASPMCQWQPLQLANGWQSQQNVWDSGDPAYCIDGGVVYLSGSLAHPGTSGSYFAQLPPQARPASNVYLTVYTYAGASGVLYINANGTMYAMGSAASSFTSLAGVSFTAASTAITPISLENGWQSSQSQWSTGDPSYYVSGGMVHLSGSVYRPGAFISAEIGVLPPGARPAQNEVMSVYGYGGATVVLVVWTDGSVAVGGGPSAQFTSLAGATFAIASPGGQPVGQPLPLENGWKSGQDVTQAGQPRYSIVNGVVYLDGAIFNNGTGAFAVLPPEARPAHTLYLTVGDDELNPAVLRIQPDGQMFTYGGPAGTYTGTDITGLSGISYEVGS